MNVTIISDASYCPDTGAAGYGYWIACERARHPGGGAIKALCSGPNAAEMMAVVNAVHEGLQKGTVMYGDSLLIQSDSMAAILGFQGDRPLRQEDERQAKRLLDILRREQGLATRFKHVKGHTNIQDARSITNKLCDERARKAMRERRAQLKG